MPHPLARALAALALIRFVGFANTGEGIFRFRRQSARDGNGPAPSAVPRRPEDLVFEKAGHRLRRFHRVARQSYHQVETIHPGERRATAARPCRPAARATPSLRSDPRQGPPDAFVAAAA